jgi:5,10-methylenetetrahydromethanopterin reductase
MPWRDIGVYVEVVRTLLREQEAEWEGNLIQLLPSPDFALSLPLELPIVIAADGDKGRGVARALGAGLATGTPDFHEGFDWLSTPFFGTVLDEGESPESDRAYAAAGPGVSLLYHLLYEFYGGQGVDELPGGAAWRTRIDAVPNNRRHLVLHRGHGHYVSELDQEFIPRSTVREMTITGTADEVRQKVEALRELGMTEVMYNPAGPDVPRELERFAAAMSLQEAVGLR